MKKLLSVLLSIMMLLSAFAFAEGGELTLSNIVVSTSDGAVLDFSGVDLKLAAAADDADAGLRIALGANGEEAANAVVSVNKERVALALEGLSNAYIIPMEAIAAVVEAEMNAQQEQQLKDVLDFTEQDLMELLVLFEGLMGDIQAGIVDTGVQEYNEESFQTYAFAYGEELADALLRGVFELLDKHPELAAMLLEESGYGSMIELYEALGLSVRVEGETIGNDVEKEIDMMVYISANGMEEIALNCYAYLTAGMDEEMDTEYSGLSLALGQVMNDEIYGIAEISGCITTETASGELASFDGYIVIPGNEEDQDEGVLFGMYGPILTGTGLWQVSIADWNEELSFDVSFGDVDGMDGVYGLLSAEDGELSFYAELTDGVGEAGLAFADAESGIEVMADVALAETDGAWLNVNTANAVNILTMTDEQTQNLTMEALMVLMSAASELSAANDTIAMLAGSLLG